jgi:hypothetical protein
VEEIGGTIEDIGGVSDEEEDVKAIDLDVSHCWL